MVFCSNKSSENIKQLHTRCAWPPVFAAILICIISLGKDVGNWCVRRNIQTIASLLVYTSASAANTGILSSSKTQVIHTTNNSNANHIIKTNEWNILPVIIKILALFLSPLVYPCHVTVCFIVVTFLYPCKVAACFVVISLVYPCHATVCFLLSPFSILSASKRVLLLSSLVKPCNVTACFVVISLVYPCHVKVCFVVVPFLYPCNNTVCFVVVSPCLPVQRHIVFCCCVPSSTLATSLCVLLFVSPCLPLQRHCLFCCCVPLSNLATSPFVLLFSPIVYPCNFLVYFVVVPRHSNIRD